MSQANIDSQPLVERFPFPRESVRVDEVDPMVLADAVGGVVIGGRDDDPPIEQGLILDDGVLEDVPEPLAHRDRFDSHCLLHFTRRSS